MKTPLIIILLFVLSGAHAETDTRYCGAPARDASGVIIRDRAEVAKFKRIHPCPVTQKTTGACIGWSVDHVLPLAVGGCDSVNNMQWLPNQIKSCAGVFCKDRWELRVYRK